MAVKKEELAKLYIQMLEENKIPWECGWTATPHHNPVTGTEYGGSNRLLLNAVSEILGLDDARWFTFNEIADKEHKYHPKQKWHLKKGSCGVEIARSPYYYNKTENKYYTSMQYYKKLISLNDQDRQEFKEQCRKIFPKGQKGIIYIYNASQIEGIPPVDNDSLNVNKADDELIDRIVKNMNVGYREIATNGANYNYSSDVITLPLKNDFKDEGSYFSTKLHELCHATGHKNRLNREFKRDEESYALEELRADIAASFLLADFGLSFDEKHRQNHIAYVKSWVSILQNDPDKLIEAIRDAEQITNYIKEMANDLSISLTDQMESQVYDIDNYYIEVAGRDDGIDYTVYDKNYNLLDGGIIDESKIDINDFTEWLKDDGFEVDFNKAKKIDHDNFISKVNQQVNSEFLVKQDNFKKTEKGRGR